MKKRLWLLALVLLAGCQKMFLGEEASSDPVEVFETVWQDFDAHYSLFGIRHVDWDSLYRVYRPRVSSSISQDSLWNVLCALLEHTRDAHVGMYAQDPPIRYFNANRVYRDYYANPFSLENIRDEYCKPLTSLNDYLSWGRITGRGIGYIHVGGFANTDYPVDALDRLVAQVADCQAIIVDIRDNHGGHVTHVNRLSSWFSDNTRGVHFTQVRNGPARDDISARQEHFNVRREDNLCGRPVVLLTNRRSVSGAEWFTLRMKTFGNVTQIGDTTSGAFSSRSMDRFLPNGWQYCYSVEKLTLPNGTSPEGIGCIPDIVVRNDAESWPEEKVLSAALDYLKRRYGI